MPLAVQPLAAVAAASLVKDASAAMVQQGPTNWRAEQLRSSSKCRIMSGSVQFCCRLAAAQQHRDAPWTAHLPEGVQAYAGGS